MFLLMAAKNTSASHFFLYLSVINCNFIISAENFDTELIFFKILSLFQHSAPIQALNYDFTIKNS